jgi:phospholipase C
LLFYIVMPIEHIFILMLENRSFDHVFGFSNIKGKDAVTGKPTTINGLDETSAAKTPADLSLKNVDVDPGHEFKNVLDQLCGLGASYPDPITQGYPVINNSGFMESYKDCKAKMPERIMHCFSADQLPVLNALANEFAICDGWFSSVPGPTWPNRFFMMAATSGGLSKSPTTEEIIIATAFKGYDFEHGNIFDALDRKNIPWVIFEGDRFPLSFALKGMNRNAIIGRFVDFDKFFETQINDPKFNSKFIFIEPKYGKQSFDIEGPGDFSGGNSMHPLDDVRRSEALVKKVYELLHASKLWDTSVLMILFDEHGGFYDHVHPPGCVPPGDKLINASGDPAKQFKFDQLGVRVPAIIVSPLIKRGIIDHTPYDHTSALATVEKLFNLDSLTDRDKNAKDLLHLFSLSDPRTDTPPKLPDPVHLFEMLEEEPEESPETLKEELEALNRMKLSLNESPSERLASQTQIGFCYVALLKVLEMVGGAEQQKWKDEFSTIHTWQDAARFMTKAKLKIYYGINSIFH